MGQSYYLNLHYNCHSLCDTVADTEPTPVACVLKKWDVRVILVSAIATLKHGPVPNANFLSLLDGNSAVQDGLPDPLHLDRGMDSIRHSFFLDHRFRRQVQYNKTYFVITEALVIKANLVVN